MISTSVLAKLEKLKASSEITFYVAEKHCLKP